MRESNSRVQLGRLAHKPLCQHRIKGGESQKRLVAATFTFLAPNVSISFLSFYRSNRLQSKKLLRDYYPRDERRLTWKRSRDLNPDQKLMRLLCYRYTTAQICVSLTRLVWLRVRDLNPRSTGYWRLIFVKRASRDTTSPTRDVKTNQPARAGITV